MYLIWNKKKNTKYSIKEGKFAREARLVRVGLTLRRSSSPFGAREPGLRTIADTRTSGQINRACICTMKPGVARYSTSGLLIYLSVSWSRESIPMASRLQIVEFVSAASINGVSSCSSLCSWLHLSLPFRWHAHGSQFSPFPCCLSLSVGSYRRRSMMLVNCHLFECETSSLDRNWNRAFQSLRGDISRLRSLRSSWMN